MTRHINPDITLGICPNATNFFFVTVKAATKAEPARVVDFGLRSRPSSFGSITESANTWKWFLEAAKSAIHLSGAASLAVNMNGNAPPKNKAQHERQRCAAAIVAAAGSMRIPVRTYSDDDMKSVLGLGSVRRETHIICQATKALVGGVDRVEAATGLNGGTAIYRAVIAAAMAAGCKRAQPPAEAKANPPVQTEIVEAVPRPAPAAKRKIMTQIRTSVSESTKRRIDAVEAAMLNGGQRKHGSQSKAIRLLIMAGLPEIEERYGIAARRPKRKPKRKPKPIGWWASMLARFGLRRRRVPRLVAGKRRIAGRE